MAATLEDWVDGWQSQGRYTFLRAEAVAGSGLSPEAVKKALKRLARRGIAADNPWCAADAQVRTFCIDELLGTKLRALYQRQNGRNLFDLWFTVSRRMLDHKRVLTCFTEYMERQGHSVSRAQFEQNLHDKESDPAFLDDTKPLLRPDIDYDAGIAMKQVRMALIEELPGDPWKGLPHDPG